MRPALFLVLTLACCLLVPASAATRPNILLVLCDDIGAHELSLYGHPRHKTPVLDKLGKTGIWFTTGYSTPICHPTRFQIMTGQYAHHDGVNHFRGSPGGQDAKKGADDIARQRTVGKIYQKAG